MAVYYLVNRTQQTILTANRSWTHLENLSSVCRPMAFPTADSCINAKRSILGETASKKICAYTEETIKTLFGISIMNTLLKKPTPAATKTTSSCTSTNSQTESAESKSMELESIVYPPMIHTNSLSQIVKNDDTDELLDESEGQDVESVIGVAANAEKTLETPFISEARELLKKMLALKQELKTLEQSLPSEMIQVNKTMQDELHFAEFEQLNVVEGYRSWLRIHNCRITRRRIKNESEVALYLEAILNLVSEEKLKTAITRIEKMNERKYRPRTNDYPTTK